MITQKGVHQSARGFRELHSLAESRVLKGYKVGWSVWLARERKKGPWLRALLGSRLERGPAEGTLGKQRKGTRYTRRCVSTLTRVQDGHTLWEIQGIEQIS